jgi:hypothetical protein
MRGITDGSLRRKRWNHREEEDGEKISPLGARRKEEKPGKNTENTEERQKRRDFTAENAKSAEKDRETNRRRAGSLLLQPFSVTSVFFPGDVFLFSVPLCRNRAPGAPFQVSLFSSQADRVRPSQAGFS